MSFLLDVSLGSAFSRGFDFGVWRISSNIKEVKRKSSLSTRRLGVDIPVREEGSVPAVDEILFFFFVVLSFDFHVWVLLPVFPFRQ